MMAFRNITHMEDASSDSLVGKHLVKQYESYVVNTIKTRCARAKSRTFAPSSLRCERKSWFRLRGSEPDELSDPDLVLNYLAEIGTDRHFRIQTNLISIFGDDWIDPEKYMESLNPEYTFHCHRSGIETQIEIENPPVKFACDGIIRIDGKIYLLEIKTSDYASFEGLSDVKGIHMDQIKLYAALLDIQDILVLYEDRQYGNHKCFQIFFTREELQSVLNRLKHVMDMVESNLAPPKLLNGDYMCTNCEYKKKCKEW